MCVSIWALGRTRKHLCFFWCVADYSPLGGGGCGGCHHGCPSQDLPVWTQEGSHHIEGPQYQVPTEAG